MRAGWIAVLLAAAVTAPAGGQTTGEQDVGSLQLTRPQLDSMLTRYEQTANNEIYSAELRRRAQVEAERVRQRLTEGDVRVGDLLALTVEREAELSTTFMVLEGRKILLPKLGEIPLAGVLRSELEGYLTTEIAKFVRDPTVRVLSPMRIEITGAVGDPGFKNVRPDMLVTGALSAAGGAGPTADVEAIRIRRGGQVLLEGEAMREAIQQGRTLDQLSVRTGDTIEVPEQSGGVFSRLRGAMSALAGLSSFLFLIERIL